MFKISRHNQGFKVSTGLPSPVVARDVDELHLAIDHYFARERASSSKCPLCRWVAEHTVRRTRRPKHGVS